MNTILILWSVFLFFGGIALKVGKGLFSFLAADHAILGMLGSGLVLVFTGQAWAGVLLLAKAAFLLCASAFGFRLATQGVKVTMMPLISPPPPDKPSVIVTPQSVQDSTDNPASS